MSAWEAEGMVRSNLRSKGSRCCAVVGRVDRVWARCVETIVRGVSAEGYISLEWFSLQCGGRSRGNGRGSVAQWLMLARGVAVATFRPKGSRCVVLVARNSWNGSCCGAVVGIVAKGVGVRCTEGCARNSPICRVSHANGSRKTRRCVFRHLTGWWYSPSRRLCLARYLAICAGMALARHVLN